MKKWTKVFLILFGCILLLFAALSIAVRSYLTPDRLRAFIIPEAEKALGRKVTMGGINIGFFRGITVNDLSVKEADGLKDFVTCREFVLTYKLLPLLSRQVVIDELSLKGPRIALVRDASGSFNYKGIGGSPGEEGKEKGASAAGREETKPLPVSFLINHINVSDAGLTFADSRKEFPDVRGRLSADMSVKIGKGTVPEGGLKEALKGLQINGSVKLLDLVVEQGSAKAGLSGDIQLTERTVSADIKGTIGKNTAQLKGRAENLFDHPHIRLDLYAKELGLDELIALASSGEGTARPSKPENGPDEKTPASDRKSMSNPVKITASGEIRVDSVRYNAMAMTDFRLAYSFKENIFEVADVTAMAGKGRLQMKSRVNLSGAIPSYTASGRLESLHAEELVNAFFPKAKGTVYGLLSANFSLEGAGSTSERAKRSLVAEGDFSIKDGKITNTGLADALALFLGVNELRTIHLRQGNGTVRLRNGVAHLESIFSSDDIAMNPHGTVGLNESLDLACDLKLSPRLAAAATRNANVGSYIKDDKGWGSIPLKITGTFSRPSYGIDVSKAGKRIIEKKGEEFLRKLFR